MTPFDLSPGLRTPSRRAEMFYDWVEENKAGDWFNNKPKEMSTIKRRIRRVVAILIFLCVKQTRISRVIQG